MKKTFAINLLFLLAFYCVLIIIASCASTDSPSNNTWNKDVTVSPVHK